MSETATVLAAFLISYGLILGHIAYVHLRRRKAGS